MGACDKDVSCQSADTKVADAYGPTCKMDLQLLRCHPDMRRLSRLTTTY